MLGKCTETAPLKKVNGNTREFSVDLHKIFTFEFVLKINYSLHSSSCSSSDTVYLHVHQCAATQWQEAPCLVTQKTTTSLIYIYIHFRRFGCGNAIILKIYFYAWLAFQCFGICVFTLSEMVCEWFQKSDDVFWIIFSWLAGISFESPESARHSFMLTHLSCFHIVDLR